MPLTPRERDTIERLEAMYRLPPFEKHATIPSLVKTARRLDRESRRQRKSIRYLRKRLSYYSMEAP